MEIVVSGTAVPRSGVTLDEKWDFNLRVRKLKRSP